MLKLKRKTPSLWDLIAYVLILALAKACRVLDVVGETAAAVFR